MNGHVGPLSIGGLVDTHAHLCDVSFDGDLSEVLERARTAGVLSIIAVGETLEDGEKNLALAKEYAQVQPAAGLYPTHLDPSAAQEVITFIKRERDHLVAIGEVGLDFWAVKEETQREIQREIFAMFIELGKKLHLPLNVHSRSAGRHAIGLLLEKGATKVQLHAFDGKAGTACGGSRIFLFHTAIHRPFPPKTKTGEEPSPFLPAP